MAHPQSPHMPSSPDLPGGFGTLRSPQDVFRAFVPPHVQDPLSSISPKISMEASLFTTGIHDTIPAQDQQAPSAAMKLMKPESMQWRAEPNFTLHLNQSSTDYHIHAPFSSTSGEVLDYAQNGMSYDNNCNMAYVSQYPSSICSKSFQGLDLTRLSNDIDMSESHPPAAYQIEPQRHHNITPFSDLGTNDRLMQTRDDYEQYYSPYIKLEREQGYNSPYSDMTRASTPNDDPLRYPQEPNGGNDAVFDKEQPYAQLIYQALLQADGHTMILRDIYDWFVKYTDKAAASETNGWQNSIRHNLSMNGAFEKVDQPGEESRKGFMWRLTEEAIREGVKSTTRYRSKQPNKRAQRTQHPQPQRQASGAKGGQAARRSANMKRSKRIHDHNRNEPYISRSVPAAFDPCYSINAPILYAPYYTSDLYTSPHVNNDYVSPHLGNGLEVFPPAQLYTGLPGGDAYVLAQSPREPLFTNSPTPSADEPRTPMSQDAWNEDAGIIGTQCSFVEKMPYQEYSG